MPIIVSKRGVGAASVVEKSDFQREHNLQEYIHLHPEAIPVYDVRKDKRLLVVCREFPTNSGPIDALAVDQDGDIYIVETKLFADADKRRVVAQALDYGAALWKAADVERFMADIDERVHSKWGRNFRDKVQEFFDLDDELVDAMLERTGSNFRNGNLKFVVLMDTIDERLRDLITYINQKSQFDIYAVELEYYRHEDYEIIIPKVYGFEVKKDTPSTANPWDTTEEILLAMASERGTSELLEVCRGMRDAWDEGYFLTAGGSFRYFAPKGIPAKRLVYGINVSGKLANSPPLSGQLDVWLQAERLAKLSGFNEDVIKKELSNRFVRVQASRMDFVLRLKDIKESELFVSELRRIAAGKQKQSDTAA